jgi:peptidoglycan hydrolase-like protein with peptidoglycan-binding domain
MAEMDFFDKEERGLVDRARNYTGASDTGSGSTTSQSSSGANASKSLLSSAKAAAGKAFNSFTDAVGNIAQSMAKAGAELLTSMAINKGIGILLGGDVSNEPTVKQGSKGEVVARLQQYLNQLGAQPELIPDGLFGVKTYAAVRAFQQKNTLTVDGIVGPHTWAAIKAQLSPSAAAVIVDNPATISSSKASANLPGIIIKPGDKNAQVLQFQTAINNLGYGASNGGVQLLADGIYGTKTSQAVSWAQAIFKVPQENYVSEELFALVTSSMPISAESKQVVSEGGKVIASSTSSARGSFSESYAKQFAAFDPHVFTTSRATSAIRSKPESQLLLEAVVSQVTKDAGLKFFNFFDALNGLVPAIVEALAWHESSFNNAAIGASKEVSMFQLLPRTVTALASKFSLLPLNIANAASLASYVEAMLRDIDQFAGSFFNKSMTGSIGSAKPGNEYMTDVVSKVPQNPPLISQLFTLFMLYNAGLSQTTWSEDWRAQEALKRTLSVMMAAGGY